LSSSIPFFVLLCAMALDGTWATPVPIEFQMGLGDVFLSEDGDTSMTFDQESRQVTLTKGDFSVNGTLGVNGFLIKWENGSKWSRMDEDKDITYEQPDLFSEAQTAKIVDRINEKINIWGISEETERGLIEVPVNMVNSQLKDCLRSFMTEDWGMAMEVLLDDTKPAQAKQDILEEIFDRQLKQPLADALNGKFDIPLMGEDTEDKIFQLIVDKVLESMISIAVLSMEKTDYA